MQIKAKRIDGTKNHDRILLTDSRGYAIAVVHIDVFHETGCPDYSNGPIYDLLNRGEEVTLNVELAEAK